MALSPQGVKLFHQINLTLYQIDWARTSLEHNLDDEGGVGAYEYLTAIERRVTSALTALSTLAKEHGVTLPEPEKEEDEDE